MRFSPNPTLTLSTDLRDTFVQRKIESQFDCTMRVEERLVRWPVNLLTEGHSN